MSGSRPPIAPYPLFKAGLYEGPPLWRNSRPLKHKLWFTTWQQLPLPELQQQQQQQPAEIHVGTVDPRWRSTQEGKSASGKKFPSLSGWTINSLQCRKSIDGYRKWLFGFDHGWVSSCWPFWLLNIFHHFRFKGFCNWYFNVNLATTTFLFCLSASFWSKYWSDGVMDGEKWHHPCIDWFPVSNYSMKKVNCFPPIVITGQRLEQLLALDGSCLANTIFVTRKTLRGGNKIVV